MKRHFIILSLLCLSLTSFAYAQDAGTTDVQQVSIVKDAGVVIADGGIIAPLAVNTAEDVAPQITTSINYVKTGQWLLLAMAIIQILVFLCKKFGKSLWGRWNTTVVLSLSGIAGMLFYFSESNWGEALILCFSGLAPMIIHDVLKNIKNKAKNATTK